MTMAMITVSGRPFILNSRNIGGNVSKLQGEVTILAIISPGFTPTLCKRRTSPLCSILTEGWGDSVWPKTRQQFARRKSATSNRCLHFMGGPHKPEHSGMRVYGATYMPGEDGAEL